MLFTFGKNKGKNKMKEDYTLNCNETDKKYKIMFPDYPDIVTVAQLRKMLGIIRHLAYDLIAQKRIKAFQLGNSYKIPKVNVIDYIICCQEDLERTLENNDITNNLKMTQTSLNQAEND